VAGKVKKEDLLRFLEGQREAERRIREEKRRRLLQLTEERARRIYDELCEAGERISRKEREKLQRKKIIYLLERRRRFDLLSRHLKVRGEPPV